MKIQKGIVKYKDRSDIICTYAVTDDGRQYYFMDDGNEKVFTNGNRIATTALVEAVDPMVKASNIGVIDPNGVEVVPFRNRSIRPINDDLILVEVAEPVSPSVIQSVQLKSDPLAATRLVSTPALIKDRLNQKMSPDARYVFNDQFSEATLCDISGNNLIGNQYFSFIAFDKDKLYFSGNTVDSEIFEYSILPPEVQSNVSNVNMNSNLDVSQVNVGENVIDQVLDNMANQNVDNNNGVLTNQNAFDAQQTSTVNNESMEGALNTPQESFSSNEIGGVNDFNPLDVQASPETLNQNIPPVEDNQLMPGMFDQNQSKLENNLNSFVDSSDLSTIVHDKLSEEKVPISNSNDSTIENDNEGVSLPFEVPVEKDDEGVSLPFEVPVENDNEGVSLPFSANAYSNSDDINSIDKEDSMAFSSEIVNKLLDPSYDSQGYSNENDIKEIRNDNSSNFEEEKFNPSEEDMNNIIIPTVFEDDFAEEETKKEEENKEEKEDIVEDSHEEESKEEIVEDSNEEESKEEIDEDFFEEEIKDEPKKEKIRKSKLKKNKDKVDTEESEVTSSQDTINDYVDSYFEKNPLELYDDDIEDDEIFKHPVKTDKLVTDDDDFMVFDNKKYDEYKEDTTFHESDSTIGDFVKSFSQLMNQNREQRKEIIQQEANIVRLKKNIAKLNGTRKDLLDDVNNLRQTNDSLSSKLRTSKDRITDLQVSNQKLEAKLHSLERAYEQMTHEVESLRAKANRENGDMARLLADARALLGEEKSNYSYDEDDSYYRRVS